MGDIKTDVGGLKSEVGTIAETEEQMENIRTKAAAQTMRQADARLERNKRKRDARQMAKGAPLRPYKQKPSPAHEPVTKFQLQVKQYDDMIEKQALQTRIQQLEAELFASKETIRLRDDTIRQLRSDLDTLSIYRKFG